METEGSLNVEETLIIVGDSKVGKTSFINILKGSEEKITPTSAIEYSYTCKININRKELVNIYEVGGGRNLEKMI